jgi:hypothetical protein
LPFVAAVAPGLLAWGAFLAFGFVFGFAWVFGFDLEAVAGIRALGR